MDDEADVEGGRGAERVHRVTVRGQFRDLSEQSRQFLVRSKADHDIFVSAYTPEGTFTYDDRIQFFNLRYEIRCGGDDPIGLAAMTGEVEAETFLRTMGWRRVAEQELPLLSPRSTPIPDSYSKGVNAYLAEHAGDQLSLEYAVLGLQNSDYLPEPWQPADSVAWLKALEKHLPHEEA